MLYIRNLGGYMAVQVSRIILLISAMALGACSEVGFNQLSGSSSKVAVDQLDDNGDGYLVEGEVDDDKSKDNLDEDLPGSTDDSYLCDSKLKKVLICHVPPGNPAAKHTICISKNALDAHLDHGNGDEKDYLGYCRDSEEESTVEVLAPDEKP